MKKIYLAREYTVFDTVLNIRIDEEAVFGTFKEAINYLKTLEDKGASENFLLFYRHEIIEYPVGRAPDGDKIKRWVYSINGTLIEEYPDEGDDKCDFELIEFDNKYQIGEIVYIKPQYYERYSPFVKGVYGVIGSVPAKKEEWIENGKEISKWDGQYVIHYIDDDGMLEHVHAYECTLKKPKNRLPEELKFLKLFSMHLKGVKKIPDDILNKIVENEIYVKNIKAFDFKKEGH